MNTRSKGHIFFMHLLHMEDETAYQKLKCVLLTKYSSCFLQCYISCVVVKVSVSKYTNDNFWSTNSGDLTQLLQIIIAVTVISLTSICSLQTFAIPGSISLSILSGFLFPFPLALMLVCFCSATGASLCYVLSFFLGRRLVYKYFPEKASQWALTVSNLTKIILIT
jgi:hypothetical protein